jgi:thiol-disulfide isomerase/thioredoxin
MRNRSSLSILASLVFCLSSAAFAGGAEYTGQFEKSLAPNIEEFERIILARDSGAMWKNLGQFGPDTHFTAGRLANPMSGQYSVVAILIEDEEEDPVMFVDMNDDRKLTPDEKVVLKQEKEDNPYLWIATIPLPVKGSFFTHAPIFVRYYKSVKVDKMAEGDRLVTQSTEVMARGSVDIKGRRVIVQYAIAPGGKKVNPQEGWLGVDIDGNGQVDMDNLSPEAAKADAEAVVFRVGETYISTKKADLSKNQIVLREHEAKDYKRVELALGKPFPEFTFTDFDGKKRKISEFRGKYVLLDIWGFWCGPCRRELPYIREAHKRFQARNLEIVGLNTDPDFTIDSMKKALNDNGMKWTNAKFDSVIDFLKVNLRINSFPTTFLISPEGKILSMSRQERDEPDLRGRDLLTSLEEILPE